jgi:Icc protein
MLSPNMNIAWATDIHLDHCSSSTVRKFVDSLGRGGHDAILLGGDIGQAPSFDGYLLMISEAVSCPVFFVLGNHDFYGGSIREVRERASALASNRENLHYLSEIGVVPLSENVALVGHDGWADGRLGDFEGSPVLLNDFVLIEELTLPSKGDRLRAMRGLADEAADHLGKQLPEALANYEEVIVLTHVPPFREACWHEGETSGDDWLPFFASQIVGEAILDAAKDHRDKESTVLCGHTHGSGRCQPLPNVTVHTSGAEYGQPEIQRSFGP